MMASGFVFEGKPKNKAGEQLLKVRLLNTHYILYQQKLRNGHENFFFSNTIFGVDLFSILGPGAYL